MSRCNSGPSGASGSHSLRSLRCSGVATSAIAVLALFLQREVIFQLLADTPCRWACQNDLAAPTSGENVNSSSSLPSLRWSRFSASSSRCEIGVQFLLVAPGGAVDALQLRVLGVAAPIGAGDLGQLERVADLGGGAEMRPAAQVVPVAMPIDRDILVRRECSRSVRPCSVSPMSLKCCDRLVARPHFAAGRAAPALTISCIFASIFGRSSGVKGSSRAKS